MNDTSDPNERKIHPTGESISHRRTAAVKRWAPARSRRRRVRGLSRVGLMAAATLMVTSLGAGCAQVGAAGRSCAPRAETLPASGTSSLVAVVPRTSTRAASWGLDELAQLLPFVARGGLELHVLYTQDADDVADGGGDGGPPQVLFTEAPRFPGFQVGAAPQPPSDPTSLTGQIYCEHLAAWQGHASDALRADAARRSMAVRAWTRMTAGRLAALAEKAIPDTSGPETGVEIDAGASIFSAAQVAEASPHPTILFLGGLTALTPPSQNFRFPARLIALVRSSDPGQVLHAEIAWSRWVDGAGGSFEAVSDNDAPSAIVQVLVSRGVR